MQGLRLLPEWFFALATSVSLVYLSMTSWVYSNPLLKTQSKIHAVKLVDIGYQAEPGHQIHPARSFHQPTCQKGPAEHLSFTNALATHTLNCDQLPESDNHFACSSTVGKVFHILPSQSDEGSVLHLPHNGEYPTSCLAHTHEAASLQTRNEDDLRGLYHPSYLVTRPALTQTDSEASTPQCCPSCPVMPLLDLGYDEVPESPLVFSHEVSNRLHTIYQDLQAGLCDPSHLVSATGTQVPTHGDSATSLPPKALSHGQLVSGDQSSSGGSEDERAVCKTPTHAQEYTRPLNPGSCKRRKISAFDNQTKVWHKGQVNLPIKGVDWSLEKFPDPKDHSDNFSPRNTMLGSPFDSSNNGIYDQGQSPDLNALYWGTDLTSPLRKTLNLSDQCHTHTLQTLKSPLHDSEPKNMRFGSSIDSLDNGSHSQAAAADSPNHYGLYSVSDLMNPEPKMLKLSDQSHAYTLKALRSSFHDQFLNAQSGAGRRGANVVEVIPEESRESASPTLVLTSSSLWIGFEEFLKNARSRYEAFRKKVTSSRRLQLVKFLRGEYPQYFQERQFRDRPTHETIESTLGLGSAYLTGSTVFHALKTLIQEFSGSDALPKNSNPFEGLYISRDDYLQSIENITSLFYLYRICLKGIFGTTESREERESIENKAWDFLQAIYRAFWLRFEKIENEEDRSFGDFTPAVEERIEKAFKFGGYLKGKQKTLSLFLLQYWLSKETDEKRLLNFIAVSLNRSKEVKYLLNSLIITYFKSVNLPLPEKRGPMEL